jgi:regulator of cell morphogenesis and NO signaling
METLEHTFDINISKVADLAMDFPGSTTILNKYHIDYCCGGKIPFKEACEKVNANPQSVLEELKQEAQIHTSGKVNFKSWTPVLLVNYITQHHHTYVKQSIPEIKFLLDKVSLVHGNDFDAIHKIVENFNALSAELLQHMNKEELILFPAIIKLFDGKEPIENDIFPISVEQPMAVMEDEHQHAGDLIKSIRELTDGFTPPSFACPTFRIAYARLQEFDQDLTQHIHLENNILFQKVRELLR